MPNAKSKPCKKVKQPCKICLGTVTEKNGLQCQGACQTWVHYDCCNYTPGKIDDIKKGIIKVTCPCPDCATRLPKEYRTDKHATCMNKECPANHPPRCTNQGCPTNANANNGQFRDNMNQISSTQWPNAKCGVECKKTPQGGQWPRAPCGKECKVHSTDTDQMIRSDRPMPYQTSSEFSQQRCDAGCSDTGGDGRSQSYTEVEKMFCTVGMLTKQLDDLMCRMRELVESKGGGMPQGPSCNQPGLRSKCPKPCHCQQRR